MKNVKLYKKFWWIMLHYIAGLKEGWINELNQFPFSYLDCYMTHTSSPLLQPALSLFTRRVKIFKNIYFTHFQKLLVIYITPVVIRCHIHEANFTNNNLYKIVEGPPPCINQYLLHVTFWRYTNADLKISLFVLTHIKVIPWKFSILNPKTFRVTLP